MNRVYREEKKYLISLPEFIETSHRLSQIMHEDPHNGVHGYRIRSLYFDTIDDVTFMKKLPAWNCGASSGCAATIRRRIMRCLR